MKTYVKPNLNQINIFVDKDITSLNTWLTDNALETYQDSITTYQYNS